MSQAEDFHAFGVRGSGPAPKKNWSLKVEPAQMAPKGPVDVKTYHAKPSEKPDASK